MNEFEYLEKTKNEIITIDNLNKKRLKPAFGEDINNRGLRFNILMDNLFILNFSLYIYIKQ